MSFQALSSDNPVVQSFLFYGAILLLKTLSMAALTAVTRIKNGAFNNPEDFPLRGVKSVVIDEDVERIRRAHQNDLENIYVFLFLGMFYILSNPDPGTATLLFRVFTGARILHSIVYVNGVRQPARFLAFMVGTTVNIYMAVVVVLRFMN